jgi:hypothetical protein
MGLLDDAIREHLELKRRRGADPGEVALQERAALDPGYAEEPEPAFEEEEAPHLDPEAPPAPVEHAEHVEHVEHVEHTAFATPGQETAEFDMEAALEADTHEGHQGDVLGAEAIHAEAPAPGDELIEWETPVRPGEQQELPEQIPGQERLTFE